MRARRAATVHLRGMGLWRERGKTVQALIEGVEGKREKEGEKMDLRYNHAKRGRESQGR